MADESESNLKLTNYSAKKTLFPIQGSEPNSGGASHGLLFPCVSAKDAVEDGVQGESNAVR